MLYVNRIRVTEILPRIPVMENLTHQGMFQFAAFINLLHHHHHHPKHLLTLFVGPPSYYLGISKVILNNINLAHQRQKVCCELFGAKNCQRHLGAKSCGHPRWCPPPGTAVSDNLKFYVGIRGVIMQIKVSLNQNCGVHANLQSQLITFWHAWRRRKNPRTFPHPGRYFEQKMTFPAPQKPLDKQLKQLWATGHRQIGEHCKALIEF